MGKKNRKRAKIPPPQYLTTALSSIPLCRVDSSMNSFVINQFINQIEQTKRKAVLQNNYINPLLIPVMDNGIVKKPICNCRVPNVTTIDTPNTTTQNKYKKWVKGPIYVTKKKKVMCRTVFKKVPLQPSYINNEYFTTDKYMRISPEFLEILDSRQKKQNVRQPSPYIAEQQKQSLNVQQPIWAEYFRKTIGDDGDLQFIYNIDFNNNNEPPKTFDLDKFTEAILSLKQGNISPDKLKDLENLLDIIKTETMKLENKNAPQKYNNYKLLQLETLTNYLTKLTKASPKVLQTNFTKRLMQLQSMQNNLLDTSKPESRKYVNRPLEERLMHTITNRSASKMRYPNELTETQKYSKEGIKTFTVRAHKTSRNYTSSSNKTCDLGNLKKLERENKLAQEKSIKRKKNLNENKKLIVKLWENSDYEWINKPKSKHKKKNDRSFARKELKANFKFNRENKTKFFEKPDFLNLQTIKERVYVLSKEFN